jgi:hypothetical protein
VLMLPAQQGTEATMTTVSGASGAAKMMLALQKRMGLPREHFSRSDSRSQPLVTHMNQLTLVALAHLARSKTGRGTNEVILTTEWLEQWRGREATWRSVSKLPARFLSHVAESIASSTLQRTGRERSRLTLRLGSVDPEKLGCLFQVTGSSSHL